MKMKNKTNQRGFTLIELMIVVLIIGILSGVMLGVINISGIQSKSRDAKRIGDIKKIQTALELYFSDYRGYPRKAAWSNVASLSSELSPTYINTLPIDPRDWTVSTGVSCFGYSRYRYFYKSEACVPAATCLSGRYVLGFVLEVPKDTSDPDLCKNLGNCSGSTPAISCLCSAADGATETYCYGVENPL